MKKYFTLKNIILLSAAFVALLCFCLSFAVRAFVNTPEYNIVFKNAIWSASHVELYYKGALVDSSVHTGMPFALPIIGYVLAILSVFAIVFAVFFIKDAKIKKIVTFVCAGTLVVGGIFTFFFSDNGLRTIYFLEAGTMEGYEDAKKEVATLGSTYSGGVLGYILASFLVISGLAVAGTEVAPLIKK